MIWSDHGHIGILESGDYTVRRVTMGSEAWFKHGQHFKCLGRASSVAECKALCEQHRRAHATDG